MKPNLVDKTCGLDWIVQCLTSPPTQYRLYGRRFLQVKRPNQDKTCELLKWLCNYRKLHNTTTREQLWQYSLLLLTKNNLRSRYRNNNISCHVNNKWSDVNYHHYNKAAHLQLNEHRPDIMVTHQQQIHCKHCTSLRPDKHLTSMEWAVKGHAHQTPQT